MEKREWDMSDVERIPVIIIIQSYKSICQHFCHVYCYYTEQSQLNAVIKFTRVTLPEGQKRSNVVVVH